ncbi:hypothetical protein ACF0H5_010962 [Mactra antiquata]
MATAGGMQDSYIGGIINSSLIPQNADPFYVTLRDQQDLEKDNATDDLLTSVLLKGKSSGWSNDLNQTDEDKMVTLTCKDDDKQTNINRTEEYNIDYTGLSILPWEEFVFNPRVFNDLFYAESNHRITFDPEEVNVFFHGQNVMPPTIGDISLNGKSWNIEIDSISNLRKVRQWLTEKCSVFGVTLQYKEKRFGKPVNVPCLVMVDPTKDSIGDRLYTSLTRAMDSLHNQRRFCVEINLNACIERWCKRVLFTDCKAIGAKLVITNGEEYANLNGTEDIICCVFCFPVWLLQTGIYKLHRTVTYDDFMIDFEADDMFFHGSFQDSQYQRQHIFNEGAEKSVFRTRNAQNTDPATLDRLGTHKFVSVKKIKKSDRDIDEIIKERTTGTFGDLVDKRKDKILKKDVRLHKMLLEKENKLKNECKPEKPTSNVLKIVDGKHKTLETVNAPKIEHVNEAYSSDEEEHKNEPTDTPRLPEITSEEYTRDNEKTPDIEIPSEVREHSSVYLRPTDSIDALLTFSERKGKKGIDNKSMTAVCSFENFDQVSQTDTSESEEEEEEKLPNVIANKDNLLDEMSKIEKSLPVIASENKAKDISELKEEEKEAKKTDSEKEGKSKHHKIKVGRVLKDLMKTTEKQNEQLPSIQDPKYIDSKNKLKMKAQSTKTSKSCSPTASDLQQTVELSKKETDTLKDAKKSNEEKTKSNRIIESGSDDKDKVESFDKSRFSISSSSDGDTVEMLYESHRSMTDVTSFGSDTENQTAGKQQNMPIDSETSTTIDYIARANIPKGNRVARSEDIVETISKDGKEIMQDIGRKSKDSFMQVDEDSNIDCIKLQGRTLIGVQRMQSFLDVTDMEDLNELDEPGPVKPTPNVPSLKLDSLNKKSKRGTKQYNSNRRYLGAALPNKQKKRFT